MRKVSANLILPVSSAPLRNGIIKLDDSGTVLELIDTGGKLKEEAGLEFYNGVIIPGLIIPWIRLGNRSLGEMENLLPRWGIRGAGLIIELWEANEEVFKQLAGAGTIYHPVLEICEDRPEKSPSLAFELLSRGIELVSHAFNEYHLSCSLMNCSRVKNTELEKYIREYTATHENAIPAGNEEPWKGDPDVLQRHPRKGILEILPAYTLEAAGKLFLHEELGSIGPGKRPGLNLLTGLAQGTTQGKDSGTDQASETEQAGVKYPADLVIGENLKLKVLD